MLFVIIGHDGPDGAALRPKVRPAHLENLRPLIIAGKVKIAGPFTDGSQSHHCRYGKRGGSGRVREQRSVRDQRRFRERRGQAVQASVSGIATSDRL